MKIENTLSGMAQYLSRVLNSLDLNQASGWHFVLVELESNLFVSKQNYSKNCVKRPLSQRPKIGFQDWLLLNAGQKYCRMLQREHFSIISTFIKLPFVIKIFVWSIFEGSFYTGFTANLTLHATTKLLRQEKNGQTK